MVQAETKRGSAPGRDRQPGAGDAAAAPAARTAERRARTRRMLKIGTPLVAMLLTLGSATAKLLIEWLPTLQPIAVVLVVFFAVLGPSALLQLYLHWRDLETTEARSEFLQTVAYGVFLFAVMVGGMFARYFWELFQLGLDVAEADVTSLLLPLLVSLMAFYPLWTMVSGAPKNFFAIVAAFQNGFFWQTIFSGLKPFPTPAGL
jgi:hypothetical protein